MDFLLIKAQKGDHEAYTTLFAKYEADLYQFIYTQCGNVDFLLLDYLFGGFSGLF